MARKKVFLLVGTHKGAFIFSSDENRKKWKLTGPLLKGADVGEHIAANPANELSPIQL